MEVLQLKGLLERAAPDWKRVQEIRLRAGKPVALLIDGAEWVLSERGGLFESPGGMGERPVLAEGRLLKEILETVSRHSLYAYEEEIRQGFLTIEGGHRLGISGHVVAEGEEIRTIRDISSLNLRLAHEIKGCADAVLPWLVSEGEFLDTLILSPPGAGKTTLLRDLVRQLSDGSRYAPGKQVSVVDERSEIGASFRGVPQCDVGMRTDLMDGCPKEAGMLRMLRSMGPQILAVDEVGTRADLEALLYGMNCGCKILATAHGTSIGDIRRKPVLKDMARERLFSRYVVLSGRPVPGTVAGIYDGDLGMVPGWGEPPAAPGGKRES